MQRPHRARGAGPNAAAAAAARAAAHWWRAEARAGAGGGARPRGCGPAELSEVWRREGAKRPRRAGRRAPGRHAALGGAVGWGRGRRRRRPGTITGLVWGQKGTAGRASGCRGKGQLGPSGARGGGRLVLPRAPRARRRRPRGPPEGRGRGRRAGATAGRGKSARALRLAGGSGQSGRRPVGGLGLQARLPATPGRRPGGKGTRARARPGRGATAALGASKLAAQAAGRVGGGSEKPCRGRRGSRRSSVGAGVCRRRFQNSRGWQKGRPRSRAGGPGVAARARAAAAGRRALCWGRPGPRRCRGSRGFSGAVLVCARALGGSWSGRPSGSGRVHEMLAPPDGAWGRRRRGGAAPRSSHRAAGPRAPRRSAVGGSGTPAGGGAEGCGGCSYKGQVEA
jgi:hypothetical protein